MDSRTKERDSIKEKSNKKSKSKSKGKKEHKHHKRGLLDILETHACIGSEVGVTEREKNKKKIIVKDSDALPYSPSLKSIPSSSLSEDSNVAEKHVPTKDIKKNSRHKRRVKEYSQLESTLPKSEKKRREPKDSSFQDKEYNVNTFMTHYGCDSYPVKVKKSKDSLKFSDILPEVSNDSLFNEDPVGSETLSKSCLAFGTIAYSKGRKQNDKENFDHSNGRSKKISDNVYPVKNDPTKIQADTSKISQRDDEYYDNFFKEKDLEKYENKNNVNFENKSYLKSMAKDTSKPTLCVFDCNKYPLTDSNGNILKTANGDDLVILKNGRPYSDCFKRLIYDKKGECSDSFQFDPYDWPIKSNEIISEIPLYDFRGYPLTDNRGASLINANGKKLVVTGHQNNILYDINGNPIFDETGMPVTKKDNCWLNPRGTPYRVFNKSKYPLTDNQGLTLTNRNKIELIKCDKHGRPIFDFNGEYVSDINGYNATDPRFNPVIPFENELDTIVIYVGNIATQIFDKKDVPLTDAYGVILRDASGKNLLNIDLKDNLNPKNSGINTIIPCKVFNRDNYCSPSISSDDPGEGGGDRDAKRASFITYTNKEDHNSNSNEKPLKDKNGDYVYDFIGQQVFLCTPSQISKKESMNTSQFQSVQAIESATTIKFDKKSAYFNQDENSEIDFETETDIFGRPLCDEDGTSLFDKYGRPVKDLFLRPLYDSNGCPISTANGKLLINGSQEMPGVHPGFDLNYLTLHDPEGRLKLTDRFGGPIHDNSGRPLYNSYGKPYKDAFDRPLYDEEGNPLCDEKGLPASQVIKEKSLKLISVEDKFQKLTVSSQNRQKSTNGGLTHEQENDSEETYWARVRLTTFVNGEKAIELLEIVPAL